MRETSLALRIECVLLRETLAQWQDALKAATGTDAISRQTEAAQRGLQQAADNFRELAQLEAQARNNSWKRRRATTAGRWCRTG